MKNGLIRSLSISLLTLLAVGIMMMATPKAGAAFKFLKKGSEVPNFTLENLEGRFDIYTHIEQGIKSAKR